MRRPAFIAQVLVALVAFVSAGNAHADGIAFSHSAPSDATAGLPLHITGNVSGAGELARARVFYRKPGGRFSQVELRPNGGDEYEAVIPGRDVRPPAVEYYVVAVDLLGRRSDLFASESNPASVPVASEDDESDEGERPKPKPKPRHDDDDAVDAGSDEKPRPKHVAHDDDSVDAGAPAKQSELEQELAMYGAEDVVSLATKHEQVVSDAPAIASSLSDEEMRQLGARIVPDALKVMPGFDISRDTQGFYRMGVRGLRADPEVLVLYDGHAINSPYDGRAMLEVPVDSLERVEVVRGPGSALYGTGAFLGAVNLVPRRRDEVAASAAYGSYNTLTASANAGHSWGGFGIYGDGSVQSSKGYQSAITEDFNSAGLEAQGLKAIDAPAGTTDDKHSIFNVGAQARAELSAGTFALSGRVLQESRGALLGLYDTVGPGSKLDWTVALADATWNKNLGGGALSARVFFDQQQASRLFQLSPADVRFSIGGANSASGLQDFTSYIARTLGAEVAGEISLHPTNRLDLGLSVEQQSLPEFAFDANYVENNGAVTLTNGLVPQTGASLEANAFLNRRALLGVYVQDQWRPVAPLSLTFGIRADAIQLPTVTGTGAAAQVTGKRFVTSLDPRLGVVLSPLPNLNVKLLYGRAFRAPTIQELSNSAPEDDYSGGTATGNPNLTPATVDTLEAGAEHVIATSEGKLRLRGDVFWNRFSHPILAVDTSGNDTPLQNRDPGIDVKGFEAEVRFEASARANAFANASYFRAVDLAALAPQFENLVDVPQYRLNVGLQLPVGQYLNIDLVTELGAERRNDDLSKLEALHHFDIPAYALVSAQLRTETLFSHLELALAGYNVLQQNYQDDVPRPDRVTGLLPGPGFSADFIVRFRL